MRYFGVSEIGAFGHSLNLSFVFSANETLLNQWKYSKTVKNLNACYSYSFMGDEFCILPDYTASPYNKHPYSE